MNGLIQTLLDNSSTMGALLLATMGIILIFRTSYTTNFAQTTMGTFSAFFFASMIPTFTSWLPGLPFWMYFIITLVLAIVLTSGLGVLVDVLILRNSKRIGSVGKQMITMGIVLILSGLIPVLFGVEVRSINNIVEGRMEFGVFYLSYYRFITFIVAIIVIAVILLMLRYTKWGLGVRATASNEMVASMMGVNTRKITAITWGLAGGLAAVAAILYGQSKNVNMFLLADIQIYAFLAAIAGGFTTFYGPLVGAVGIPIILGFTTYLIPTWSKVAVYTIILIIVLIKPVGIFGKRMIKKV